MSNWAALRVKKKEGGSGGETLQYLSNMIYKANKNGMLLLNQQMFVQSEKLLLRADRILSHYLSQKLAFLVNLTCNNLACCYKK